MTLICNSRLLEGLRAAAPSPADSSRALQADLAAPGAPAAAAVAVVVVAAGAMARAVAVRGAAADVKVCRACCHPLWCLCNSVAAPYLPSTTAQCLGHFFDLLISPESCQRLQP